ncbi:BAG family molecular chaperone regulator 5, mitochondrial-like [Carya illinoinensis]|uniref:BAG family molecular chaperone regulator 5, mitochondrial-like n=1 Tax=Carya illinoinensis TaxID=32201 RepID=UPI001C71B84D|nr:BAG family molecular chaperone regulator 5, mitochondrial-like [Carya illinoinensis]
MALLLKLDSVPGVDPSLRGARRKVSHRIVGLQEIVDAISEVLSSKPTNTWHRRLRPVDRTETPLIGGQRSSSTPRIEARSRRCRCVARGNEEEEEREWTNNRNEEEKGKGEGEKKKEEEKGALMSSKRRRFGGIHWTEFKCYRLA